MVASVALRTAYERDCYTLEHRISFFVAKSNHLACDQKKQHCGEVVARGLKKQE
jgi:hypothetical protein